MNEHRTTSGPRPHARPGLRPHGDPSTTGTSTTCTTGTCTTSTGTTSTSTRIAEGGTNPAGCTPRHACGAHDAAHAHGPSCGHPPVPHGDHVDYLVGGHLHHPHGGHCDDHGALDLG